MDESQEAPVSPLGLLELTTIELMAVELIGKVDSLLINNHGINSKTITPCFCISGQL